MVSNRSFRQPAVFLIEYISLRIALRHEGLVDDVGEYQTDILVKIRLVLTHTGSLMLTSSVFFEGVSDVLLRLILPTVLDSAHSRVMSEKQMWVWWDYL